MGLSAPEREKVKTYKKTTPKRKANQRSCASIFFYIAPRDAHRAITTPHTTGGFALRKTRNLKVFTSGKW